jgi:hypothetical protein
VVCGRDRGPGFGALVVGVVARCSRMSSFQHHWFRESGRTATGGELEALSSGD